MAQERLDFVRKVDAMVTRKRPGFSREPENPVRYAYMKLLRERDETLEVFEVDPFAEVYTLRKGIYGIYIESIDGMGDAWMFLIEGKEKALLIDTGFGIGDLKSVVHELIGDKPFYVANTHSHGDHALGNYQFDKVYCHEYEVQKLEAQMNEHIWDRYFDENGDGIWYDCHVSDHVPFKEYEIVGVPDGYTFELGPDHEVELVFLPGHSIGHCGFLDKKNRIFFPGDDCCIGAIGVGDQKNLKYGEYGTVEALCKEFKKIYARRDEFDSLFPSHGPVETGPIMILSAIEACEKVLENPSSYDMRQESERGVRYGKMIFESGYLTYSAGSVYMYKDAEIE